MGSFDYCSPECRNKHLLPIQKALLSSELKELTDQLHAAAVADVTDDTSGKCHTAAKYKLCCIHSSVAVLGRNQTLFCCVFQLH